MRIAFDVRSNSAQAANPSFRPSGIFKHNHSILEAMARLSEDIEVVPFVSHPHDIKKYLSYLSSIDGHVVNFLSKMKSLTWLFGAHSNNIFPTEINNYLEEKMNDVSYFRTELLEFLRDSDIVIYNWKGSHGDITGQGKNTIPVGHTTRFCATIYDLISLENPQWFGESQLNNEFLSNLLTGIKSSHRVICTTEHVKKSVLSLFSNIHEKQVVVSHLGVDKSVFKAQRQDEISTALIKYGIPQDSDYILCVSTIEPRKNYVRVLQAFQEFRAASDKNTNLVIVGAHGWESDSNIKKLVNSGNVITPGYVEDQDLPALYSGARTFCFPSLDEGFGMPLLEAMACATPIITSNLGSMKEICEGVAVLVDPYSIKEIKEAMLLLCSEQNDYLKYSNLSQNSANDFSWEKTATRIIEQLM